MTQKSADYDHQARQFYEAEQYEEAGKLYHQLWDAQEDAFFGGRYAHCLRKCGYPEHALKVARQVAQKHPDDIHVQREIVWALYDAEFKPAKKRNDLDALVHAGQEILNLTDEELPTHLVSFAVIGLAKDKMKWNVVSVWCDHLDPGQLSADRREMGGRRVISELEQWYFAKVKALVKLEQWVQAQKWATQAMQAFPHNRHFARWGALALAGLGQLPEAIRELKALAHRERPEWYLLENLAELQLRDNQTDDAYVTACQAALGSGEDKAKVGLYLLIGQIALALGQLDSAASHVLLSRLIRNREGWSVPREVVQLETEIRSASEEASQALQDLQEDISTLGARCRQTWEQVVPPELRSKPRRKRRGRSSRPIVDADQPFQTGRIKTYIDDRGFGFIIPDDGGEDIFFHITNVEGIEQPERDMLVEYQVTETPKGLNAVNVRLA